MISYENICTLIRMIAYEIRRPVTGYVTTGHMTVKVSGLYS